MTKILVIRFSSIGDIVLTTPVIRCMKQQITDVEVHFLTKEQYVSLVNANPYIDKVFAWNDQSKSLLKELRKERYDFIVDLHKNIRTKRVKYYLRKKSTAFPKLNIKKWILVNFKKDFLPDVHIVDRYFEAVKKLGINNDNKGLDFFIQTDNKTFDKRFKSIEKYLVYAIGGQFNTKKMPATKMVEFLKDLPLKVVLIGGKEDREEGDKVVALLQGQNIENTCGEFSIHESAKIVQGAEVLITHDTGMMHIGAAFDVPIVSIWGNTVPAFGMYPYRPQAPESYSIHEVNNLDCRPCSKIGFATCPKGHFKCMMQQDTAAIHQQILTFLAARRSQ